jgi:hypothetical protein
MRTKSLCIAHCSHALLSFLPSSDGERWSTEDCDLVFRILTESLIPAAHTLVHDEAFDCKVVSIRLALHVLRLSSKKTGDAIASLIEGWYHGHDHWRGAFEAALRTMVGIFLICVFAQLHCIPAGERRQLASRHHTPEGFNGAVTQRITLSSYNQVSSCIE